MQLHLKLLCCFILLFYPALVQAQMVVDITRGRHEPLPIAISNFIGDQDAAEQVRSVIEADLERSGLFRSLNRKAFLETINDINTYPEFSNWRQIDAQILLTANVTRLSGDKTKIEFRLWDVLAGREYTHGSYNSRDWRRISHIIADEVYTRLTGEEGYFDSRIVYIAESGHWKRKTKRLAIMDQDGANHRYLTSGKNMVLTPRFDPNSQRVIYLGYYGNKPSVYLYNLSSGKEELIGTFPGMSFAPRFSPDGDHAIMSVSLSGNSEIFELNLRSRKKTRLTNDSSIDTSPSYSPDGKRIVFNSDRGGSQQLYVMSRNGSNVKRISFGKGNYGTPVWSPRGDWIAFTRMYRGKFYIGVMKPDGSGERLLTESYLDEGPTWSPNGRVIIFTRQTPSYKGKPGTSSLYSIDLTGYNERKIKTPGEASDPAWSPLLKR